MAYNGTTQGSPTFAAAKFSNGLTAVSDANYILLPAGIVGWGASDSWTIEAWLKGGTAATKVAIGTSVTNPIWIGTTAAGNFAVSVVGTSGFGGLFVLDSGVSATDGNWHHVAAVMTTGTSLKIFVDGVDCASQGSGVWTPPGASATLAIGRFQAATTFSWPGAIDEVALWDTAKYTVGFSVPVSAYTGSESGLRALYHLEADGTDGKSVATVTAATPAVGEYGPTAVQLSWAAATGGAAPYSYQVQRAPDSSGSPGTFANTGAAQAGLTFVDSGLTASTKYWWRVVATDDDAISGTSGNATITTLASGTKWNRLDGTSDGLARAVMVLVPNANSAVPYDSGTATPFVMYHHGSGEDEDAMLTDALKADVIEALIDAGYICAGISAYGNNWGNQAACDAYPDLFKFVDDRYNLSSVVFLSQSMGGLTGLLSLSQHNVPGVVAWAGIYPACNLAAIYAAGTFASAINTAYSCTSTTYAAKTNGHDPALKWGKAFRNVYMRFYASPSDVTIPKADNTDVFQALIATSCFESTIVACTGVHGDPSHFQPADLVAFYARALASPPATSGIGIFVVD